jgi:hypothetical protein
MRGGGWGRRFSGIWCRKFDNLKDMENRTKLFRAFEQNDSRIKRFRKPEQSEVNGVV